MAAVLCLSNSMDVMDEHIPVNIHTALLYFALLCFAFWVCVHPNYMVGMTFFINGDFFFKWNATEILTVLCTQYLLTESAFNMDLIIYCPISLIYNRNCAKYDILTKLALIPHIAKCSSLTKSSPITKPLDIYDEHDGISAMWCTK